MNNKLDTAVNELFKETEKLSSQQIGKAFVTFLLEAQHGSWDGVPSRDKAAMGRFVEDFTGWLKHSAPKDTSPAYVFTGSRYLTTDR
jgi:hypothetical protein